MDYPVKQIYPNHADHISYYKDKYLEDMFKSEKCIAQPKYDGERMLIHIDKGNVYCTSRRISKRTRRFMEKQDNLPVLKELFKDFDMAYTILDCEAYSDNWSTSAGILGSLPERAIELQKTSMMRFAIFDCIHYDDVDIMNETYATRLAFARDVVIKLDNTNIHMSDFIDYKFKSGFEDYANINRISDKDDLETAMNLALEKGFEGIVVKSLDRKYYDKGASLKYKKDETLDVIVIDYVQGRGKYSHTVGALKVGYFDSSTNSFEIISSVNCGSDKERDTWFNNWENMKNSVIEVKCQEVTKRSLRHPRYIRLRDDKDYTMVTRETIFKTKE